MISTKQLTRKFGKVLAVESLDLEVNQGEVFGFLGPNGAGKTTTVRMLTSLIKPTSGSAVVNGFEIGKDDINIRRNVGILTETPGLYDNLSAEMNLDIYANLYEVKNPSGQVEKYLRMLGLWERRKDPSSTFSKGMKQRIAIARSLLHEPDILFLDEPTSALDPEAALVVRDFIKQLSKEGRTIFICTHNLAEADSLCTRIAVFKTKLLALGTPDDLRSKLYGKKVVFHLSSDPGKFIDELKQQGYIMELQSLDNKLIITLDDPERRNPELIRILVGLGAEIMFVGEVRQSLENIYLDLVRNN